MILQRQNEKQRYLNIVLDNPFATNSDDQNKINKAQMRKNKSVKKVRQRNKRNQKPNLLQTINKTSGLY